MSKSKISDERIVEAYRRLKSIWKVADEVGLCGQSIHERLKKFGVCRQEPEFTESQQSLIRQVYAVGFRTGDGILDDLVKRIGKSKQNISRWARSQGLTSYQRKRSQGTIDRLSESKKKALELNGHPRGALGMKHTPETKARIAESSRLAQQRRTPEQEAARVLKGLKTRESNGTLNQPRHGVSWKSGWRIIGGKKKFYRSRWEANYARYLEFIREQGLIAKWEHEPETFWFEKIKRGTRSYLPDFRVTRLDGSIYYVEVKGYMDDRSKTKLKRMKKYHPTVELELVPAKAYKALAKTASKLIKNWE